MTAHDRVEEAFAAYPRELFLPKSIRMMAGSDEPLRIGHGQTNSQPSLVKRMLRWLDAQPGDAVLDVGSGSGWTSALLSYVVAPDGFVFAVEKVPELVEFGRQNAAIAGARGIEFNESGQQLGLPDRAPYDRILVSASAKEVPKELADQLKPGGKMVVPVKNDILEIIKKATGVLDILTHSGFYFVPLVR